MSKSGTPKLSDQVACLFMHFPIVCRECGYRIEWDEERDWDHLIEEADGGDHGPVNFRPIHARSIGCHRKKTKRSAGQRAEAARQQKAWIVAEAIRLGELVYTRDAVKTKPKAKLQSRPFPSKQMREQARARMQERR